MNSSSSMRNELDPDRIPKHVAVIMDGNGRWAKKRLLNRLKGHEKGAEAVRTIVRTARKLNIDALTLYAFSTENWQRPQTEVSGLMFLLRRFLETERPTLMGNDIRLNVIGQIDRLPEAVRKDLKAVMAETAVNNKMVLTLALSYGARTEIVDMVRQISRCLQKRNHRSVGGDPRDGGRSPLYPRTAGPRFADSHQRGDAHQQLSTLADRLCGDLFYTDAVARLRRRGVHSNPQGLPATGEAFRRHSLRLTTHTAATKGIPCT